jgi:hypothetical protein
MQLFDLKVVAFTDRYAIPNLIVQLIFIFMEEEMKKSNRFLLIASLFCALIICSSSIAMSDQQVKIPYVISGDGWWTGIAITNESDNAIEDMTLYYTTDKGASGTFFATRSAVIGPGGPGGPGDLPQKVWTAYKTNIGAIDKNSIVAKTVTDFYSGDGAKILPSNSGSVVFSHEGSEKFYVTVYIGSATGFAFQVFESTAP